MKFVKKIVSSLTAAAVAGCMAAAFPMTASAALPDSTASFMDSMGAGWNLGNTLDANDSSGLSAETSWGNPKTTENMVKAVHSAGFETIRIPVSWAKHLDPNYKIDSAWLARVKEVVDYAYNDGMHVIINIHHDNLSNGQSGMGFYPDEAHKTSSLKFINSVWSQVAEEFKDYDEKLIFETLNEPQLIGSGVEWADRSWSSDPSLIASIKVINEFNQQAVNTIRSGSGYNKTRYIMTPSYAANAWNAMSDEFVLPTDPVSSNSGKIVVSAHAYTPYDFCLSTNLTTFDDSCKRDIDRLFSNLNSKLISKGIPVIMGETGATFNNNQAECDKWAAYYFAQGEKYDIPCVLWDNNVRYNNDGESHAHLDRSSCEWYDPTFVSAIMNAVKIETPAITYGDLNDDGNIDLYDVTLMRQKLLKWNVEINEKAADVDCDGELTLVDLAILKKYILKWVTKLGK